MKALLPLFVFVDALGWEIIRHDRFGQGFAPHRRRLTSVFGYSSACVPSILSGAWPEVHRNWSYFVYDPKNSPFRSLRPLRWLPRMVTSRRRVRRQISKWAKYQLGFKGYFDLYNIPFENIELYDFTEKKSPLLPGGMNRGLNIFDLLEDRRIPYHVSEPERSEPDNLASLLQSIETEQIDFAFLYWPALDGLLHRVGNRSSEVPLKLRAYEPAIERLCETAGRHYEEVRLYVFGDHGMANCDQHLDLKSRIDALGLQHGRDYAVVYDSTMARFWFLDPAAREKITAALAEVSLGRILPDEELRRLRTFFPDRYFGELIFLLAEGGLIVPSHMGERPIRAMHGYHPDDPHSYAALLTNQEELPEEINAIPHMFRLMVRDAELAHQTNDRTQTAGARPAATSAKVMTRISG